MNVAEYIICVLGIIVKLLIERQLGFDPAGCGIGLDGGATTEGNKGNEYASLFRIRKKTLLYYRHRHFYLSHIRFKSASTHLPSHVIVNVTTLRYSA